jgi:GntR family transcriptional regulator, arabinose operon transcriptional repressor
MQLDRSSGIPLHIQVSNLLASRILDGEWPVGGMLPSEQQLCAQLSISRGTLRQALAELQRSGYVRREQGRGTFIARGQVRLNQNDLPSRTLAFLVPYVLDSFAPSLLMGVEHKAKEHGYSVLFHHVENSLAKQAEILRRLKQTGVAGIVLYPVDSIHIDQAILRIQEERYPLVVVDRYFKHLTTDYVTADNFGGALRATQHLIALGHRRIGFLTSAEPAVTMEHRQLGYREALVEADLVADADDIWGIECYPTMDMAPLAPILSAAHRPTAILAASDRLALALYKLCRTLRLRIPEDLAIVGFGDFGISAHLDPPLTSVALPTLEMGRKAAEVVMGRIDHTIVGPQQHMLPTNLIVRASCGTTETEQSPENGIYSFIVDQSPLFVSQDLP